MSSIVHVVKLISSLMMMAASWMALSACQEANPSSPVVPTVPSLAGARMESERDLIPDPPFRVIAYVTANVVPAIIPYQRLTHLNYAFLIPNADGTFASIANGWKLKQIVGKAHQAGVQVLISVGGWGWDAQFESLAADPASRAAFVRNLSQFVAEYELDGADIDWEYPDAGQSAQKFLALITELRQAMPDKLLTTAVVSYGENGEGVLAESFPLFDFINVMTYDGPDHGSMSQFQAGLDFWQGRGLPPEKMVLGVPFYAQPSGASYRQIVTADPRAAYLDSTEHNGAMIHYNGIPTIQAKTRLALERAGGIMFWTLEHDAHDELSLIQAIDETVQNAR